MKMLFCIFDRDFFFPSCYPKPMCWEPTKYLQIYRCVCAPYHPGTLSCSICFLQKIPISFENAAVGHLWPSLGETLKTGEVILKGKSW